MNHRTPVTLENVEEAGAHFYQLLDKFASNSRENRRLLIKENGGGRSQRNVLSS
jgi:hypothetical protein